MAQKPKPFTSTIAALDIGSTKVACFIGRITSESGVQVTGIGHQLSRGIRSGHIVDIAEAQTSILAAVNAAELMAGERIDSVVVNLAGVGLTSRSVTVDLTVAGEHVTERDVADIMDEARSSVESPESEIIHCFPVHYGLDDIKNIRDPRGMIGHNLGADLHIVTAPAMMIRNIVNCLAGCHLNASEFVLSPYVSGLACLEPDEMDLGVTLIDMGGGVTSVAVFSEGKTIFTDVVPVGGTHVTNDLAKGLSTSIAHAERLKTLHGSAISAASDDQAMIDVPPLGEEEGIDGANLMPRSMLVGIIRPRLEEIFEIIRSKLEMAGIGAIAGRRVVITGGASQLLGAREQAARLLGKQVRLGKPHAIAGLADAVSGPAFSCPIGMLEYARRRLLEERLRNRHLASSGFSAARILQWLKDNF